MDFTNPSHFRKDGSSRRTRRNSDLSDAAETALVAAGKPVPPPSPWVPAIAVALAALVVAVFGQAMHYGFLSFDDNQYIQEIPAVQAGLHPKSIWWAFTHSHVGQWHPLTSLSFMFDSQISGLKAGWFHMHNVLLQAATASLLFLALRRLTGSTWRSAFAAAIFAIHPLRAESVAWVTERKDVLSGLFLMATLWAYAFYLEKPEPPPSRSFPMSTRNYVLLWSSLLILPFLHKPDEKLVAFLQAEMPNAAETFVTLRSVVYVAGAIGLFTFLFSTLPFRHRLLCLCFALGLISKPMLVTIPFVFLLLDFWPLKRLQIEPDPEKPGQTWGSVLKAAWPLVHEKIPLFLMSFSAAIGAVFAVGEPFRPIPILALVPRLLYIPISYCNYLWQFFVPTKLSAHYPFFAVGPDIAHSAVCLGILTVLTVLAWMGRRKQPLFLVAWLWFLGAMLPVIGLVPGGIQIAADRYTYIPQIGLAMFMAWAVGDLARIGTPAVQRDKTVSGPGWPETPEASAAGEENVPQQLCVALSASVLVFLSLAAYKQTQTWKDDETLWAHALSVTKDNDYANEKYASALQMKGGANDVANQVNRDTAEKHFRTALNLNPHMVGSLNNLSVLLRSKGELDEAAVFQKRAAEEHPKWGLMHRNLASIYAQQRKFPEAIASFEKAVQLSPNDLEASFNLGLILSETSNDPAAIQRAEMLFRQVVSLQPRFAEAHFSLGNVLYRQDKKDAAIECFRRAVEAEPRHARAHNNLASLLGAKGDRSAAIQHYQNAINLDPTYLEAYRNLGESLIKNGDAQNAVTVWRAALNQKADDLQTLYRLSWILATHPDVNIRRGFEARDLALKGAELTQNREPMFYDALAAAEATLGKFDEAVEAAQKALQILPGGKDAPLAPVINARLELYKNRTAYRETPPTQ
jgi:tetratricopeptide (TPR) repeat protein